MWPIILLLFVGSCYSSPARELPGRPAVPELPGSAASPAVDSRIIGGVPATIEAYPFAVQVLYLSEFVCGGSLLTRRHVLSAAHCFVDPPGVMFSPTLFSVRVGTANLNSGGSTYSVSRIINFEYYNTVTREHDLSVLLLDSNVTLSASVGVVSLPLSGSWVPGETRVTVIGWGTTNPNVSEASPVLNQVEVKVVYSPICVERYRELQIRITPNMMCSGILDVGGRDACEGDGGGPVIETDHMGKMTVVGVTSWGEGCGNPYYPRVNTRVGSYVNWILNTIAQTNSAPSLWQTSVCLLLLSFLVSTVFQ